jgi:hypothetical protein
VSPDEYDRTLARLARLAGAARERMEDLAEGVRNARVIIDELSVPGGAREQPPEHAREGSEHSKDATSQAQVEAVSK